MTLTSFIHESVCQPEYIREQIGLLLIIYDRYNSPEHQGTMASTVGAKDDHNRGSLPIKEHLKSPEMPTVQCPIEGCEYATPDVDPVIADALITTHATSHQTPSGPTQTARVEKVKRPSVSLAGTTEDWQYFKSRWNDYVKATRLEGTDRIIQLLECCDDQLRKDLTRNAGGTLTGMTEDEVFTAIRRLAIREENTMVARVTLHNMRQDRDEPIRAFGARLRGRQASASSRNNVQGVKPTWTTQKP